MTAQSPATIRYGTIAILLAVLCWGLLGVMSRVAMADGSPPLTVAFWRAAIAAVLFTVHAAFTRAEPMHSADRPAAVFLGVAGVAVLYYSYLNAIEQGGVALSSILMYSAPIWVAIGGRIFFHERVSARAAAALSLTLVGVAIVALASGTGEVRWSPGAVGWGLLSGAMYALYFLVGRRLFSRNASSRVMAWALGVGAATMLPFVQFQSLSRSAWGGVAFLAVVCTYAAYLAYAEGVKRLPSARAATIATLEPVIAVVAAYVVWGERLSPLGLAGAALVIAGVLLSAAGESRRGAASPRQPASL
ncbi:DMT family transporter [Gemmatimonas groenlandica]|uniref:EamA family transporter n=1 Tax=Gemmatimonas groenlandica TaxID=2732249 RepID=A0A6M4IM78_9BACT|nr:EamA family transporter [Gemmatimonas groenlandica]QJR34516.1 EamA family transporter [Gemmatimonas groenlandica]